VTIAQIDTGVDLRHPDLAGQFAEARDFVTGNGFVAELHGTAVAGVMVAHPDANVGLVGVAPGARVIPLRACWETGDSDAAACSSFSLAKALQYSMRRDVQLINLSLTGPHDVLLGRLIDRATAQGIAVIAAAEDDASSPGFPASHPGVIAVGSHASSGGQRTLLAPGDDVLTTTPNATWGFESGASFSAAHVTGLSALLLEISPDLTPRRIEDILRRTGTRPGGTSTEALVDPCAALTALRGRGETARCSPLAEAVDR
jgi:subtilisin family serine protease